MSQAPGRTSDAETTGENEAGIPYSIAHPAEAVDVWGLPLSPLTLDESVARVDELVRRGKPGFFITANLNYAMISAQRSDVRVVNAQAEFILADGMPLVWASRLQRTPLPERVAGSDLIWRICELAARRSYRIYFVGGEAGVADAAAQALRQRFRSIQIVGMCCPPFRPLSREEEDALIDQIRAAAPHILIFALGQPAGELWIARNCERMRVPIAVQLGASLDFIAGKVRRAPRRLQLSGLEWAFRLAQEPRRLVGRYFRNGLFLIRMFFGHTRTRRPST